MKTLGCGCWAILALLVGAMASAAPVKETGIENIPDVLISTGSEKSHEYAIIVEKSTQNLYLYAFGESNRVIFRMACSTGEVRGAKSRAGDKKTPEGVYFFIKEHLKKDLAPIYGSRAFPMDYPNLMDQISERDGNSIWMHGTNKPLKPRDSNGCIALNNQDIDKLAEYITLNRTPIIVVDKLTYTPAQAALDLKKPIEDFLKQWEAALEHGTYHEYLTFYDEVYLPDISWWPAWLKIKAKQESAASALQVDMKNIMMLKFKTVYVVLFDQVLKTADTELFAGTRKLFLAFRDNRLKIVGDVYQVAPDDPQKGSGPSSPLVAAGQAIANSVKVKVAAVSPKVEKTPEDGPDVKKLVEGWLTAWSSKDIKKYGAYYAKDFKSQGGAGLEAWLDYKRQINQKYDYIKVTQRNLVVRNQKNKSVATFIQNYESSGLKTEGTKQLILVRENGQWKIFREIWQKR
ncbi:MAG: L,D-transpeptidase family protein [Thermodesulfobacteriota bacterium]